MVMFGRYAGRADLSTRLFKSQTGTTAELAAVDRVIEAASRDIDRHCGRFFYCATQTRYYVAPSSDWLAVDDLISISAIDIDSLGDRTYAQSWATTDYDLDPVNARLESPPSPFTRLVVAPNGRYGLPDVARGIRITGKFGHFDERTAVTTLSAAITSSSATSASVTSAAELDVGDTIQVGSEQLGITAISGTTLTVLRGVNGTSAATHLISVSVERFGYPAITEAALIHATRLYKRHDAPFGIAGAPDVGQMRIPKLDPDAERLLAPFKKKLPR